MNKTTRKIAAAAAAVVISLVAWANLAGASKPPTKPDRAPKHASIPAPPVNLPAAAAEKAAAGEATTVETDWYAVGKSLGLSDKEAQKFADRSADAKTKVKETHGDSAPPKGGAG